MAGANGQSDNQSLAVVGVIVVMVSVLIVVGMLIGRGAYLSSKRHTDFMEQCTKARPPAECEKLWQAGMY